MGPPNGELMLMLMLMLMMMLITNQKIFILQTELIMALNEFMLNIQIQYLVMTQMQASANIVLIGICQL